ncbi:hypothetical protein SSP24_59370 [Streptomyces spinoverrucosus]|uniref:Uncharacterized protein n=1 Tax=Streptomyces spinoverrucosus TaxID=284043 RepID=A0A4Y3VMP9_9ACTN|nr:hypothetical protein SSP24_59370 [Streptomyces spinoverrucosus]GHB88270.1 hypothetical protein GCM10010397_70340 [Streptomyces spinoverrucosus]
MRAVGLWVGVPGCGYDCRAVGAGVWHAVALIGSGDAGVYAMASPALAEASDDIDVVGAPGVTACGYGCQAGGGGIRPGCRSAVRVWAVWLVSPRRPAWAADCRSGRPDAGRGAS